MLTIGETITTASNRPQRPGLAPSLVFIGLVATAAAGYVSPSALGAGAAWLLDTQHVTALESREADLEDVFLALYGAPS